jgi:hypothetical protein
MDYSASSKGANGLIATLLIAHSRPGPGLVFHHPPVPQYNSPRAARDRDANSSNPSDSDSDESDSELESRNRMRGASDSTAHHPEPGTTEISNPLETILGYDVEVLKGCWAQAAGVRKRNSESV